MTVPYLDISTKDAKIGLKSYTPPMKITQESANMNIKGNAVENISISRTASQLFIDQTEAFADAGLKSPLRKATEHAQQTTSKIYEYMAKKMRDGDAMMKIENGSNVIPRLAVEHGKIFDFDFKYTQVPKGTEKVKFSYIPSDLNIYHSPNRFDIQVKTNKPKYQVADWKTGVYLKQKESISFSVVGQHVNRGM
ncbi:DUF6470 family protein [Alkalihalobacterium bogoriense]|uniref:DUF6470 family protein n=1 Tax=Alkalihalobacterium bogoriense TaxID=246272 RepID=UPI00047E12FC|nr:DUF6470 family protein [Alkalihalobacterium bogoriense]